MLSELYKVDVLIVSWSNRWDFCGTCIKGGKQGGLAAGSEDVCYRRRLYLVRVRRVKARQAMRKVAVSKPGVAGFVVS